MRYAAGLLLTSASRSFFSPRSCSLRPPVLVVKNRRYAPAGRLLRGVWPSTMYNDHAL
jgi:hypothetical protein